MGDESNEMPRSGQIVPNGWRLIKTGPRDGSPMLMWAPDYRSTRQMPYDHGSLGLAEHTAIGFWLKGRWVTIECEDQGSMGSTQTGWMESFEWVDINPTHWMPLPEPPK